MSKEVTAVLLGVLAAVVIALVLVACGGVTDPAVVVTPAASDIRLVEIQRLTDGSLYRYVDAEAGVVYWAFPQAGIDCMPIGDTRLALPGNGR